MFNNRPLDSEIVAAPANERLSLRERFLAPQRWTNFTIFRIIRMNAECNWYNVFWFKFRTGLSFFRPYFHCYLSSFIIAKIAFMFDCIFLSRVDLRVQGHINTFFVSLFLYFSFSFYFSFQFASSSKDTLDTFSVKCKCKNVWKRSFYAQIDDKSRCRGETLNRLHKLMLKRQMNKEGKFLKKLWCCVGGRV